MVVAACSPSMHCQNDREYTVWKHPAIHNTSHVCEQEKTLHLAANLHRAVFSVYSWRSAHIQHIICRLDHVMFDNVYCTKLHGTYLPDT